MFKTSDVEKFVEANKNLFSTKVKMFEAMLYSPLMSPILVLEAFNLIKYGFELKSQTDL